MPVPEALTGCTELIIRDADANRIDVLVVGTATLAEMPHVPSTEAIQLLPRGLARAQRENPDRDVCLAALRTGDAPFTGPALRSLARSAARRALDSFATLASVKRQVLGCPRHRLF